MKFTDDQQRAIDHRVGNLQLVACAGSGKTEVVARRVANLLNPGRDGAVAPRNIIAFTFTDKAAAELKERIIYLSALGILREAEPIDSVVNGCSVVVGLESYRALLEQRGYFDYSAILESAVDVLTNNEDVRKRMAERVRHVIVDEYQDVNPIQEAIVWLLHSLGAEVCVVGDDDQTIYQWRGSDVQNILSFATRYPDVQQVRLEEHFRSSPGIVETARAFIEQNALAVLLRSVKANGEPITRALAAAGIPYVVAGMNNLFGTAEAEAARQLFYFMAGRPGVDVVTLEAAWVAAKAGVGQAGLKRAVSIAEQARTAPAEPPWFGASERKP